MSQLNSTEPFEGLGTIWVFELPIGCDRHILPRLQKEIKEFNSNYSRFDPQSQVSLLNTQRFFDKPSQEFVDLINLGIQYYTNSKQLFNFLLEQHLVNIGYDKTYSFENKQAKLQLPIPDRDIIINDHQIVIKNGGVDFGGFGKGYLIAKLKRILSDEFNLNEFVINGGGDIFCQSKSSQTFHLQHPTQKTKSVGSVKINNLAIASSSTFLRQWKDSTGQVQNHLINPLTQESIDPSSVFVISDNPTEADMLATTISIANQAQIKEIQKSFHLEFLKMSGKKVFASNYFKKIITHKTTSNSKSSE